MKPKVEQANIVSIGVQTEANISGRTAGSIPRDARDEGLMLTGDENIVDIGFVVIWKISKAEDYLFKIQNPDTTVKEVAESAMREVVGQNPLVDRLMLIGIHVSEHVQNCSTVEA